VAGEGVVTGVVCRLVEVDGDSRVAQLQGDTVLLGQCGRGIGVPLLRQLGMHVPRVWMDLSFLSAGDFGRALGWEGRTVRVSGQVSPIGGSEYERFGGSSVGSGCIQCSWVQATDISFAAFRQSVSHRRQYLEESGVLLVARASEGSASGGSDVVGHPVLRTVMAARSAGAAPRVLPTDPLPRAGEAGAPLGRLACFPVGGVSRWKRAREEELEEGASGLVERESGELSAKRGRLLDAREVPSPAGCD
jgi:hypothetical protein